MSARSVRSGVGCCLTFHRAVSAAQWASQPNRGFHLDLSYLERLLRHLRQAEWDVVTMDDALRRAADPGSRRFVNFSVDDCYQDTIDAVVPLFRRYGAPVTLFVTTGIPDRTLRLRDAGLETILLEREHVVDADTLYALATRAQRRRAFAAISRRWSECQDGDNEYVTFCARHAYDADTLDARHGITWQGLRAAVADNTTEIGGHTVSHERISTLPEPAAREQIAGCRDRLEAALDRPVRHFAFPYGRAGDCGERDFALVEQAGFSSAATTSKGLLRYGADPFRLPRNTLNGAHRALPFAYLHLTGASGVAARMLNRA